MEELKKLIKKVGNIEMIQTLKDIEKSQDPYYTAKQMCIFSGLIAFNYHVKEATQENISKTKEMAINTSCQILERIIAKR